MGEIVWDYAMKMIARSSGFPILGYYKKQKEGLDGRVLHAELSKGHLETLDIWNFVATACKMTSVIFFVLWRFEI